MDSILKGRAEISEADLINVFSREEYEELLKTPPENISIEAEVHFAMPMTFGPVAYNVTLVNNKCVRVSRIIIENHCG